jgi:hypothetical protein
MFQTYRGILKGDRVEWTDEAPQVGGGGVAVHVTVLGSPGSPSSQGNRMAQALKELADGGAFGDMVDPVEWQRESRRDRPMPGRES